MFVIVKDGTNFKAIANKFQIVKIPNLRKKRVKFEFSLQYLRLVQNYNLCFAKTAEILIFEK